MLTILHIPLTILSSLDRLAGVEHPLTLTRIPLVRSRGLDTRLRNLTAVAILSPVIPVRIRHLSRRLRRFHFGRNGARNKLQCKPSRILLFQPQRTLCNRVATCDRIRSIRSRDIALEHGRKFLRSDLVCKCWNSIAGINALVFCRYCYLLSASRSNKVSVIILNCHTSKQPERLSTVRVTLGEIYVRGSVVVNVILNSTFKN